MNIKELNYQLPKELIAQTPLQNREECKLLVYNKTGNNIVHTQFKNIINYLEPDDIIIFNNTKVFAARLWAYKKDTKAKIEILLLHRKNEILWEAILNPARRIKIGQDIIINNEYTIIPLEKIEQGKFLIQFNKPMDFEILEKIGTTPLPPYITRGYNEKIDRDFYQTIYAQEYGAVAAPTAGFHFSEDLLKKIKAKGVKLGFITLHISYATFAPIREEEVEKHTMHEEYLFIPEETVQLINGNKEGRIIAVGTTVVRGLESVAVNSKEIKSFSGFINTYIYPGYQFKIVDTLITNFHLPKSTLLLLVAAFIGLDKLKELYQEAINNQYRFYSYGDAMMIGKEWEEWGRW